MTITYYLQAIEDALENTGFEIKRGNLSGALNYQQITFNLINQVHAKFQNDPLLEWTLAVYKEQYHNLLIRLHFDKILVLMTLYISFIAEGDIKNAGAVNSEINNCMELLLTVYQNAQQNKVEITPNYSLILHNITILNQYFSQIVVLHNRLIAMHNKVIFASSLINNAISNFPDNQKALGLDHSEDVKIATNQNKTTESSANQFGQFWNPIKLPIKRTIQPSIEETKPMSPGF
ncbi:MAG: hypothetical protein H0U73_06305 [Tatlockia sp.]|nr:hypothetical protein [Tatlockia sp.]